MEKPWWIALSIIALAALAGSSCACGDDDDSGNHEDTDDTGEPDDDDAQSDDDSDDDDDINDDDSGDDPVNLVNLFLGTAGNGYGAAELHPGPQMPNGHARPGPDTTQGIWFDIPEFEHYSGYRRGDDHVRGFSQNRMLGTGQSDYGNVRIMPVDQLADAMLKDDAYFARIDSETAQVGRYSVTLADGTRVETTAANWTALYRVTFAPGTAVPTLLIDAGASIRPGDVRDADIAVDAGANEVSGSLWQSGQFSEKYGGLPIYFVLRISEPPTGYGTFDENGIAPLSAAASGPEAGAYFEFSGLGTNELLVKVALSHVSVERARANLEREAPGFDFDAMVQAERSAWEDRLGAVQIEGGNAVERRIFYTMLYRCFAMPTLFTESDGEYLGFDGAAHTADGFTYYTDFSLWDTFRTLHPLVALLDPDLARDFVISLLTMAEQGGSLPRWPEGAGYTECMIGTHADSVIAEAYAKGITDFDTDYAFDQMDLHATQPVPHAGRDDLADYLDLGYCAADHTNESVSMTLEYAYDDYCIAEFADQLGRTAQAAAYRERARSYENLWDPARKFFRARTAAGDWATPFFPTYPWADEFTEGDAWHYLWFVPQDPQGLIDLFGGADDFVQKLETFFENSVLMKSDTLPNPYYWHGNEHNLHAAFLFNRAGRPDLTQKWSRFILRTEYQNAPNGLAGNDDGGTLAAWYVFAAIGLYPMNPCGAEYEIGSPLFDRAVLHLPGGDLVVTAQNNGPDNLYIQSATLNGEPLNRTHLAHSEIAAGAELVFVMGPAPSSWGR